MVISLCPVLPLCGVSTLYNPMIAALLVDLIHNVRCIVLLLSTKYFIFVYGGKRWILKLCKHLGTFLEYLLETAGAPINVDLFVITLETLSRILYF